MDIKIKDTKENLVTFEVTIPEKDAKELYNKAVQKISQHINIDGFRKGKAPRAIVEKHVGTDRITMEAVESIAPSAISKAVQDNKLDIITQPAITEYHYDDGKKMTIIIQVETRPEVSLGDYKGLDIKVKDSSIAKDAEKQSIDNLLKQHSKLEAVTDRSASATDIAVIDFDGYVKDEKIQGGEGKNYSLDLGNSNFIPGFAEQIVGKNIGDEFDINVTFPKEYHDDKLKGQPAIFKIKLHELKQRVLPELNDEFAQKVGPFKTVDDLKADVKKYLENQREKTNKQNSETEMFKAIVGNAKVDIPETLISRELEAIKGDYKQRLAQQGIDWNNVVKAQGGEDKLTQALREDAVNRIKNSLVIDKIAKVENIKLEPKDLETKFNQLAVMYGINKQDVIKQLGQSPQAISSISQQALNDKVRDYLLENNNIEIVTK